MDTGSGIGSALTLEDFAASALDGAAWQGSSSDDDAPPPSTETDAPGAPPVEPTTGASEEPSDPEGADDIGQSESLATDPATVPAPDSSTPDDYEAMVVAAPPLSYRVNGQERTFDDLKVVAGGAVIAEDALPKLQQRLSERDSLFEKSQQQYQQYQDLEKLTAWKTTGQDGKEQILTGSHALEARQMALEKTTAILSTIASVFDNPDLFSTLVTAKQLPDGRWVAVPDPAALKSLTTQAELAALKAEGQVRQQFQHTSASQARPQQVDVQAVAPSVVENSAQQLGVSTLTPEDKTFLAGMVPRFVRPATAEDVRETPTLTVGEPVLDAAFGQLLQQQASMRASTAKTVQAASTVSKENAAKLFAAKHGKTTVQAHLRTTPTRQQPQNNQRAQDADDAFTMMERAASGRF